MKYEIKELKFAYDGNNNIITLEETIKGNSYYLYKDKDVELEVVDSGNIRLKYLRRKRGLDNYMNESPEHYSAKMKIVYDGYFDVDGIRIKPFKAIEEKYVSQSKKPDVVFYNEDGSILCIIEVFKTNRKNEEDIKQFNNLNLTVYEYNINNGTTELLSYPKSVEADIGDSLRIIGDAIRQTDIEQKKNLARIRIEGETRISEKRKPNPSIYEEPDIRAVKSRIESYKELIRGLEKEEVVLAIDEMTDFFKDADIPNTFTLSVCETITNLPKFIKSHTRALKSNPGNMTYLPYFSRLEKVYNKLKQ